MVGGFLDGQLFSGVSPGDNMQHHETVKGGGGFVKKTIQIGYWVFPVIGAGFDFQEA